VASCRSLATLGDEGTTFPYKKEDACGKDIDDAEFFDAIDFELKY